MIRKKSIPLSADGERGEEMSTGRWGKNIGIYSGEGQEDRRKQENTE